MTITTSTLTEIEFNSKLKVFLEKLEGNRNDPYIDTVGHPTIGIGFDLTGTVVRNIVFTAMGITDPATITKLNKILDSPPSATAQLQNQLNLAYGKLFNMTAAQVDSAFKTISEPHINNVKSTGLTFSDEFLALTSLDFNGMFRDGVKNSIKYSDPSMARAEVWYQIRYIHLPNQNESRRYSEASTFGLYNDQTGVVSKSEAIGIYKMYTHHYIKLENSTDGMRAYDINKTAFITASNGDLGKV